MLLRYMLGFFFINKGVVYKIGIFCDKYKNLFLIFFVLMKMKNLYV